MSCAVELQDVSCIFSSSGREVKAVDHVSLNIQEGEFFTLLGPSGSGKTTCLRMIGGFTLPSSGSIKIHGQDVSQLAPYARPVNTVFQDYALFPHMTILDNVSYGLMVRGVKTKERHAKAQQLLEMVQLPDIGQRKPVQLSGGQRQRVALARALINEPKVLLLDEPLGALDLKLREKMQTELKKLQRQVGITFIFVTHDQHEALSMSDRIGIFNQGKVEQVATPSELYARPATKFVAEFVGAANVLDGKTAKALGYDSMIMLRPELIHISEEAAETMSPVGQRRAMGIVEEKQFFGSFVRLQVQLVGGAGALTVDLNQQTASNAPQVGQAIQMAWSDHAVHPIEATVGL
jgi:putative spermidine/putrescine transport system ATP-binding protein